MAETISPECYTCRLIYRKTSHGEVLYTHSKTERWACIRCHLVEKKLQYSSKWKGIVKRICRQCDGCTADLSSDPDSTPRWYCYDCSQFLCNSCVAPDVHKDEATRVSYMFAESYCLCISAHNTRNVKDLFLNSTKPFIYCFPRFFILMYACRGP